MGIETNSVFASNEEECVEGQDEHAERSGDPVSLFRVEVVAPALIRRTRFRVESKNAGGLVMKTVVSVLPVFVQNEERHFPTNAPRKHRVWMGCVGPVQHFVAQAEKSEPRSPEQERTLHKRDRAKARLQELSTALLVRLELLVGIGGVLVV